METKPAETVKSIFRNVLYGFSTWILPLGLSFAATPIIVKSLGVENYGIYSLVLGIIFSFTFSIGRAITKYVAEYRVTGETDKINGVISATFLINISVGLFGALVICLSANYFVREVFNIQPELQTLAVHTFYIAAAIVLVSMINQIGTAILQGFQRFDIYSNIFNLQNFAILIGNILLSLYGFGLYLLLLWNLFIILIITFTLAYKSKKLLTNFKFNFRIKGETFRLIKTYTLGIVGYQVLSNLFYLFERGWITRELGSESLTYYVVPMTLGVYIHAFVASLMQVIFPLVSEINENRVKLKRLYLKATKVICFLVVFMSTTVIILNDVFLTLWMGGDFAAKSDTILIFHVITYSLIAIQIPSFQMTDGLGFPFHNFLLILICIIVSVPLMLVLISGNSLEGVAISRLIGFALIFLSVFYVEKWIFGEIQTKFWLKLIGMLTFAVVLAGILEKVIISNLSVNWFSMIFATFCGGVVYCVILWLLGFITEEDKLLFKNLFGR